MKKLRLPQIRLETERAQLSIHSPKGKQSIEQPHAEVDIQQPKAEMTAHTTPSKLSIDQTRAWEAMDLKHIFRRIEEFADLGRQYLLEGMARRAEQGNEMMRIENGGNPLPDIARRNSERPTYDFNIGYVPPRFSVDIHYEPSKLDIQWQINNPIINIKARKAITEYDPSPVEIAMERYATLKIDFANLYFKGYQYEQQI